MRYLIRLSAVIAAMATALLGAPAVLANADEGGHHAVFVQTNDLNGNSIAAYSQNENGVVGARAGRSRLSQRRGGAQYGGGHRRQDDRQSDQISHGSSSGEWFRHVREG